jgi:hypothetical protein
MYGSGGIAPPFLTSALDLDEWSASLPGRLTPEERVPGTLLGGLQSWSGRCEIEKDLLSLPGIEPRPSSGSTSLYRLSYPGLNWVPP